MKNIHILPTDKKIKNVGDLVKDQYGDIHIFTKNDGKEYGKTTTKLNIYITNDEEIKEGDWMIRDNEQPTLVTPNFFWDFGVRYYKIILTTDQELIKDGVQAIDDDFLEWFVKNPSCEEVRIEKWFDKSSDEECFIPIISKEEPLEEVALFVYPIHLIWDEEERYDCNQELRKTFIDGAKWQLERSYSEEEVIEILLNCRGENPRYIEEWFEQFKKK